MTRAEKIFTEVFSDPSYKTSDDIARIMKESAWETWFYLQNTGMQNNYWIDADKEEERREFEAWWNEPLNAETK